MAEIKIEEIRDDDDDDDDDALDKDFEDIDEAMVYDYQTKLKKGKFHHHHFVYHHADSDEAKRRHERCDHDHEIKIPTEQRISKLYHLVDLNKDGVISEEELASMLHHHQRGKWHPEHRDLIDAATKRMDLNSDGIIEKAEYIEHMKQSTKAFSKKLMASRVPKEDLHGL